MDIYWAPIMTTRSRPRALDGLSDWVLLNQYARIHGNNFILEQTCLSLGQMTKMYILLGINTKYVVAVVFLITKAIFHCRKQIACYPTNWVPLKFGMLPMSVFSLSAVYLQNWNYVIKHFFEQMLFWWFILSHYMDKPLINHLGNIGKFGYSHFFTITKKAVVNIFVHLFDFLLPRKIIINLNMTIFWACNIFFQKGCAYLHSQQQYMNMSAWLLLLSELTVWFLKHTTKLTKSCQFPRKKLSDCFLKSALLNYIL